MSDQEYSAGAFDVANASAACAEAVPSFTPGPWIFYADTPSTDSCWHIVTNASRMRIVANVYIGSGNEMDLANARLISAAPELYTALKHVLDRAISLDPFTEAEVRSALARVDSAAASAAR